MKRERNGKRKVVVRGAPVVFLIAEFSYREKHKGILGCRGLASGTKKLRLSEFGQRRWMGEANDLTLLLLSKEVAV